ncbi:MAG: hypothetical protein PUJ69_07085 [Porphyromonas somerae]|uniref:hypothetical protein n=1 Tax=Porphyromonas somerae TaxID=322095 RepID=UPI0026F0F464|nr:hypothetical protein [Porphyromonas somerae]MDD7558415.1 hypothetical protein [Porphyromonas somerae]
MYISRDRQKSFGRRHARGNFCDKKEIKEIPKSSVSFVYEGQNYYISIKNECDTRRITYGERIRMRILFFEGIKQPYSFIHPFAVITKVELCYPRKRINKVVK